ncbi:MAG: recombinase family protein [Clostridia bacterium]|nr:recombinase family protein [Clostridia bacterium]
MTVVGYCRISRDEDKENYSSIEEQKRIIKEYANTRNWIIEDKDFYIDDNVSGYTLNRPEFSKMMEKVRGGRVDVVIAKDLSRIGRNNGLVLVLIDEFKNMQKNLILVSEMCGSYDVLNDRDDTIGITTWFNERYVKDCSRKTRDHMYSKQKSGRLIMGNYYGYEKVFQDKVPMLYVIEVLRPVIELIFKLYVEEGYGFQKISEILNTKYNYPTPSEYYRMKHLERGRMYKHKVQEYWTKDMVSNILKNEVYTGTLITHKKRTVNIRGKSVKVPKEEHFIFENHHEPIISKEMFKLAQEIRNKKYKQNTSGANKKRDYYFSGMCQCVDCGSGMSGVTIKRKVREKGYDCSRYRQYSTKACHCHEIKEKDILIHLREFLKLTKQEYLEEIKAIKIEIKKENKSKEKFNLQNKLNILNEEYKMIVRQKIKELAAASNKLQKEIIENTYKELEKEKRQSICYVQMAIEANEKKGLEEDIMKFKTAIEYFDEIINSEKPNRMMLERVIDKICIYKDKTIRFELKPNISKILTKFVEDV